MDADLLSATVAASAKGAQLEEIPPEGRTTPKRAGRGERSRGSASLRTPSFHTKMSSEAKHRDVFRLN